MISNEFLLATLKTGIYKALIIIINIQENVGEAYLICGQQQEKVWTGFGSSNVQENGIYKVVALSWMIFRSLSLVLLRKLTHV